MFALVRKCTEQLGIYDYLRYSQAYEYVLSLRKPASAAHNAAELQFYKQLFTQLPLPLVFDVGANFGEKAALFRKLASQVICVEPDPRAVRALRVRYRNDKQVVIVESAVGAAEGQAELIQQQAGSAYNSLSSKHAQVHDIQQLRTTTVQVTTLDRLIQLYGIPSFLKVDVEGFEAEVFAGLSRPVPLLCFEANLPQFFDETVQVITRLKQLSPTYLFNAVTNDHHRQWAYTQWSSADQVIEYLSQIVQGSADVFAFSNSLSQT